MTFNWIGNNLFAFILGLLFLGFGIGNMQRFCSTLSVAYSHHNILVLSLLQFLYYFLFTGGVLLCCVKAVSTLLSTKIQVDTPSRRPIVNVY